MKLIWNSFRFLVIGLVFNGLLSAGFFSVGSMSKFSVCVRVTTAPGGASSFFTGGGGGFFFTLRFGFAGDGGLGGVAGGRDGGGVGGGVGGRGGGGGGVTGFTTTGSYKDKDHAFLAHEHG